RTTPSSFPPRARRRWSTAPTIPCSAERLRPGPEFVGALDRTTATAARRRSQAAVARCPALALLLRGGVLAAELGRRALEALVLAVELSLPRPGALEVVPHVEAQPPQPLRLQLDEVAVLEAAEPAVVGPRGEHVAGLQRVDGGDPLDAARDLVRHVARVEVLLELAVDPEPDPEVVGVADLVGRHEVGPHR